MRPTTLKPTLMTLMTLMTFHTLISPTHIAYADTQSETAAAQILRAKLSNDDPEALKALDKLSDKDIIVIAGSMDHIEQILAAAGMKYALIPPERVAALDLNADQIVMVNCPGNMPEEGVKRLERFVRAGGLLYTTDWALKNVIERAFPEMIKHNGHSTGDHVTPVNIKQIHHNLMSDILLRAGDQPQWWLEGGSYPIEVLNKRVEILAESAEMKTRYGAAPVVVKFPWHDGEVIHVVSHFYRQVKTQGSAVTAQAGVKELGGLTESQKSQIAAAPAAAKVSMGDVASSYAFQRMTSNIVAGKQKQKAALDAQYKHRAKKKVRLGEREVEAGERLKVLRTERGVAIVRDDRGNEGRVSLEVIEGRQ